MTTTNEVSVSDARDEDWDTMYDAVRTVRHAVLMASAAAMAGDRFACEAWMIDAGHYYREAHTPASQNKREGK